MLRWALAAIGVLVLAVTISLSFALWEMRPKPPRAGGHAAEPRDRILEQHEDVSLVAILADREKYEGRKVLVSGFLTLQFEGNGLHLDQKSFEAGVRDNAVWVAQPDWLDRDDVPRLTRRYARVAGTFTAAQRGHLGLYAGELTDVRLIEPTNTEDEHQEWLVKANGAAVARKFLSVWFLTLLGWGALLMWWALAKTR